MPLRTFQPTLRRILAQAAGFGVWAPKGLGGASQISDENLHESEKLPWTHGCCEAAPWHRWIREIVQVATLVVSIVESVWDENVLPKKGGFLDRKVSGKNVEGTRGFQVSNLLKHPQPQSPLPICALLKFCRSSEGVYNNQWGKVRARERLQQDFVCDADLANRYMLPT